MFDQWAQHYGVKEQPEDCGTHSWCVDCQPLWSHCIAKMLRCSRRLFVNGFQVWIARCCQVVLHFKDQWNAIAWLPQGRSILHCYQMPARAERRYFSLSVWAAHVRSPSAPPPNHPPTRSLQCEHRHKIPIKSHRIWHWGPLIPASCRKYNPSPMPDLNHSSLDKNHSALIFTH